jgi:hypothetical protein
MVLRSCCLLTSSPDLARVKVTRRDLKTGKSKAWILACRDFQGVPDLRLRDGDGLASHKLQGRKLQR